MNFRALTSLLVGGFAALTASAYNFSVSQLHGISPGSLTSLQFGPDHRLYVTQVNGQILALTVQRSVANDYDVIETETINLVRDIPNYNDDGTRNTTHFPSFNANRPSDSLPVLIGVFSPSPSVLNWSTQV